MKNVTYINAGAGSGKTYTLTEKLAETVGVRRVAPGHIILTTFTKAAANDFKAKSKAKLFEKGFYEEANLLDTAAIGTIHSVANTIISKFWYRLGLSPKLEILDEKGSDLYRSESLGTLATPAELDKLARFAEMFDMRTSFNAKYPDPMFWKGDIAQIIAYATNYQITDFEESCARSKAFFRQFVVNGGQPLPSRQQFAAAVTAAEQVNKLQKVGPTTDKRANEIAELKRCLGSLSFVHYKQFLKTCSTNAFKKDPVIGPVVEALACMWQSQEVYREIEDYIETLFDMAERWQQQYANFKKNRNLLDFNDLEKYLLALLNDPDAAQEIGAQYRYLFVDEFQDCSPMQVEIFRKLSTLVEHSYWVGDMKQSIYGFRGSAPKLVEEVIGQVEESGAYGCSIETLDTSYRSVPAIVEFCNDVFGTAFSYMPQDRVRLKPHHAPNPDIAPLVEWPLDGGNSMAGYIASLVAEGVNPSDIALVSRKRDHFQGLATDLENLGVPVNQSTEPVMGSTVAQLTCAVLRLAVNGTDSLAKAEIAFLTEKEFNTDNLITETLGNVDSETGRACHDFLDRALLVQKVLSLRPAIKHQSVAELVESVILELNLHEVAKKCASEEMVQRVLNTVIAAAQEYQETAARIDTAASVQGFIDYLSDSEVCLPGDSRGVTLCTMHTSKGLEWKHVIVNSLWDNPANVSNITKKEVFGTHVRSLNDTSAVGFDNAYIQLAPFVYGVKNTKTPDVIADIIQNQQQFKRIQANHIAEEARLLYVAMTRAKQQLILARKEKNPYQWLQDINVNAYNALSTHGFVTKLLEPAEASDVSHTAPLAVVNATFPATKPATYEKRNWLPSQMAGTASVLSHHDFGKRIPLNTLHTPDMSRVGNCIHHIYQLCADSYPDDGVVERIIGQYGLAASLTDRTEIAEAWKRLTDHIQTRHGQVRAHRHERAFVHHAQGKCYTGSIDLTLETEQGTVLVDYKTCPMSNADILNPDNEHYAGHYGGQLSCYRQALTAAGHTVCAAYLYYPVAGLLVQLH